MADAKEIFEDIPERPAVPAKRVLTFVREVRIHFVDADRPEEKDADGKVIAPAVPQGQLERVEVVRRSKTGNQTFRNVETDPVKGKALLKKALGVTFGTAAQ